MTLLDFLRMQYNNYQQSDIPVASLLRGESEDFIPSVGRNLEQQLSLLSAPEGAMDLVNPASKISGLLGSTKSVIGKSGPGKAGKEVNALSKGPIKDYSFRKSIEDETGLSWSDLRTDKEFMKKYKSINNNKKMNREDKVQETVSWINKNLSEYPD